MAKVVNHMQTGSSYINLYGYAVHSYYSSIQTPFTFFKFGILQPDATVKIHFFLNNIHLVPHNAKVKTEF